MSQYVTIIEPVFEVALFGTGNHTVWENFIEKEGLELASHEGKTNIIINVVDSRYMGIRFREFSISLEVSPQRYFLAKAYNSIGMFARAERAFFHTPYYKGKIDVSATRISLQHNQLSVFEACIPEGVVPFAESDGREELLIHLPKRLRTNARKPHYFHALLEGAAISYPGDEVQVMMTPERDDVVLNLLKASCFQVQEWRVRSSARHSKSKTYSDVRIANIEAK